MASSSGPKPDQTEAELRLRVEQAIAEFQSAKVDRDWLFSLSADFEGTPDGAVAVPRATRAVREAARRLKEALRAFEAFMAGHRR